MFVQQVWPLKPIHPNSDARPQARIVGHDGQPITIASLSMITYKVYDDVTGAQTGSGSVTVAISVFDTLQQSGVDPRWPSVGAQFAAGYNFAHTLPGTCFPKGGQTYEFQYTLSPSVGSSIMFVGTVATTKPKGT